MKGINIVSLVLMQHILHFRWIVSQFNPYLLVTKRNLFTFFLIVPIVIGIIIYFFSKAIFYLILSNGFKPTEEILTTSFSLFYFILFWRSVTHSYREVLLRAFFSKDYKLLQMHYNNLVIIRLAKLVDVYFLGFIFFTFPFFIGVSLAFNHVFDGDHIAVVYYTLNIVLLMILALLTRMMTMSISVLLGKTASKKSKNLTLSLVFYFLKLMGLIIVGYVMFKSIYNKSEFGLLFDQLKSFQSFQWLINFLTSPFLPTNWTLYGLYIQQGTLIFLGLCGVVILHIRFQFSFFNKVDDYSQTTKVLIFGKLFGNAKSTFSNLVYKDILLLSRNYVLVLPQLKVLLYIIMLLFGTSLAISEIGWFKVEAISFSSIFVVQLLVSTFAGNMVTRVTSVDSEGKMIKTLLVHLEKPFKLFLAKGILHSLFLAIINFLISVIFFIAIQASVKVVVFSIISLILISIVSSLSFLTGSVIYPRFDWDDESRIGTSSKANLLESIILRIYELLNITIMSTIGVFLYSQRLSENEFLQYSVGCIFATSLLWTVILVFVLRYPWWKGWKV
ncbi:hypothetical protein ABES80_14605 [Bacillus gobiensis]|uniref:hypothetical protein n=1 Tax=Bacillus gobiensis TaxID=1441095 RepID=UPI003D1A308E